jgi:hypothetical protein
LQHVHLSYVAFQQNYPTLQRENMVVVTPTQALNIPKVISYSQATTGGTIISEKTTPQTATHATTFTQDHILKDQVTILQETVNIMGKKCKNYW